MSWLSELLNRVFSNKSEAIDSQEAERLRIAFRDRYHHFKLLLNANNQALEKMADIERAVHGDFEFNMSFVRSRCTLTSINVLQMIKHMEFLAPENYQDLSIRFQSINAKVKEVLSVKKRAQTDKFVIPISDINAATADLVGNKMAILGDIQSSLDLRVPDGFAITTHAYDHFQKQDCAMRLIA